MMKKRWVFAAALVFFAAPVFAGSVDDFYKGKSIRIVVGFGPGGATDTISRLVQKVLPKHIPGNPAIVVENKPGGGSMLALNTVYNAEAKDGTVIVAFNQDLIRSQALGAPGVRFDARKLNWLVSTVDSLGICAARADSGIAKIQDIMNGKELVVASFGKGTISYTPFTKGVPAAETLAKTEEAKSLLRAIHLGFTITIPFATAPEVPKDRVHALRLAFEKIFKDSEFLALAEKAQQTIRPKAGEEVARVAEEMLNLPSALANKLKVILQ